MDFRDWLLTVDSKKILAAYIIKRLAENGGTMHIARVQNELSDSRGVVGDVVAGMERADILKFVSRDGQIKLMRPADRFKNAGGKNREKNN